MKMMKFFLLLGGLVLAVGCEEQAGAVADNDEVKAFIEQNGAHSSEPEPSAPITDE